MRFQDDLAGVTAFAQTCQQLFDDIDAVVADRPVWLNRTDGHAGWANSAALALAGIDDDTPDPVGGKIIREPGPMNAGTTIIAFVQDPDGYQIELIGKRD